MRWNGMRLAREYTDLERKRGRVRGGYLVIEELSRKRGEKRKPLLRHRTYTVQKDVKQRFCLQGRELATQALNTLSMEQR
jgi:hypothetical protein